MPIKDQKKLKEARKRADAKRADKRAGTRARGWACIVWQESAPEGWVEKLRGQHVEAFVSPLHDRDHKYDDATGLWFPKKPHWHVMVMFDNPASEKQAQEYFNRAGICRHEDGRAAPPEKLLSIKRYARYLVHMDDADKYRYNEIDVVAMGGARWIKVALDQAEEIDVHLTQIEQFIRQEGYDSYSLLLLYAQENRPEWLPVLRKRTIHIRGFVQSYAHDVACGLIAPPVDSPAWRRQKLLREQAEAKRRRDG